MRVTALLFVLPVACRQAAHDEPVAASSAQAAAIGAALAPSAAAPTRAWFEGSWQGAFQAELFRIELAVGGVKDWKLDDGKKASGEGKLSVDVTADGSATGTATGALGELAVAGRVEGDRAALTLTSAQSDGFHGVILASQVREGLKGTLSASSGDSLQVRQASVTLAQGK